MLFITSSILAGFRVLLFLLLGFLFRELAYIQRDMVDSVRHTTFYIKSESRKAVYKKIQRNAVRGRHSKTYRPCLFLGFFLGQVFTQQLDEVVCSGL